MECKRWLLTEGVNIYAEMVQGKAHAMPVALLRYSASRHEMNGFFARFGKDNFKSWNDVGAKCIVAQQR